MIAAKNEYCHFCGQYHPEWLEGCKNEPIIKQNIKMRKFKHKPTGEIFVQKNDLEMIGLKDSESDGLTLPTWLLEQGNDWKEIKEEPNYLITAFRELNIGTKFGNTIITLDKDGTFQGTFHLNELLHGPTSVEDGSFEIYSVKNSKGKAFILNEVVKFSHIKLPITKFEISDFNGQMNVILSNGNRYGLDTIHEVKNIYTTTDNVDIYEGDDINLFIANKQLTIPQINTVNTYWFSNSDKEVADRYLTFTSAENRDKYIKENQRKPVFTSADGKEFYSDDIDYSLFSVLPKANWQENRYRLNDIVKWPKKEWLHFHTKEARQEYIDNNKPKYSLQDIRKAFDCDTETKADFMRIILESLKKLGK